MISKTILSYLYLQYQDDGNLQAFVSAYNSLAQEYVDWFNEINLPIYTASPISGPLLDWVAAGLYGMERPSLIPAPDFSIGPYNTWQFNDIPFNSQGSVNAALVSDDTFKRILTWNFYKGDGHTFNIRWLKRRIMRFLFGVNGLDVAVSETYPISIVFEGNNVYIHIIDSIVNFSSGSLFDLFQFNSSLFNVVDFTVIDIPDTPLPYVAILQQCVAAGVLQLPFQFNFSVVISY